MPASLSAPPALAICIALEVRVGYHIESSPRVDGTTDRPRFIADEVASVQRGRILTRDTELALSGGDPRARDIHSTAIFVRGFDKKARPMNRGPASNPLTATAPPEACAEL